MPPLSKRQKRAREKLGPNGKFQKKVQSDESSNESDEDIIFEPLVLPELEETIINNAENVTYNLSWTKNADARLRGHYFSLSRTTKWRNDKKSVELMEHAKSFDTITNFFTSDKIQSISSNQENIWIVEKLRSILNNISQLCEIT
ncbi:hypothetical protein Glove_637g44 [Diversispora epigaea]|uniref:Uncharacterized protein n=1 Tax=Diversispora epigaea TaxID=1348612 RepID=A0A397GAS0_9GLOM|nr:hypothetical protein Glove_637g44 [Diversispora epigaea]